MQGQTSEINLYGRGWAIYGMKTKAAGWPQRGEVWWVGGGDWKKCGDGDPRSAEAYPSYGHPRGQNRTGAEGGVLGPLTSKVTQRTPAHAQLEGG